MLQRQLTPNSEFAALETAVAAEAEEQRRVAAEDALAAKEASMAMLMRQESVRASFTASPRSRPPKSPEIGRAPPAQVELSPESAAINTGDFLITPWRECLPGMRKRVMLPEFLCAVDAICD